MARETLSALYTPDGGLLVKTRYVEVIEDTPENRAAKQDVGGYRHILGKPDLQTTFTLEEIPKGLTFHELLAALPDLVELKLGAAVVASPELRQQAADLAAKQHSFDSEKRQREAERAAQQAELDALAEATARKRAEAEAEEKAIDEQLAAKRAALAAAKDEAA